MSEVCVAGLTCIRGEHYFSAERKLPFLPTRAALPPRADEPDGPPPPNTFDVLLTSAGANPQELARRLCESAGLDPRGVEQAIADAPGFVARNLSERQGHRLVMQIMQAGGWSELHAHEPGDAPRPSWMDDDMLESTRQMAEMNGRALLNFFFHCDWDDEHGLGVCVHGENVLDVGDWDVGESGPCVDYSPWLVHCASRAEEAYAKRVAPEIEAAREAAMPPVPPAMPLLQALWMGDLAGARRLHEQGIDINEVPAGMPPPIFAAIESMNVEHVRMALECGARTDVRNDQGQSPVQFAEELLASCNYAQARQERELAGLDQLAASPEGTAPQPGTLLGGMAAFRAMASQLLGQMGEAIPGPVEMPRETVTYHRQRYEGLLESSRQGQESLRAIIGLLNERTGAAEG